MGGRVEILASLIPYVEPRKRGRVLREALEMAREQGWRARSIAALIPFLKPSERDQALREALVATGALEGGWPLTEALVALRPYLSPPLCNEAVEMARTIEDKNSRAEALAVLIPQLCPTERDQVLRRRWTRRGSRINGRNPLGRQP